MSTAEPTTDPLRLTRCMRCGYSLLNLPREGACPECGLACEPDLVVFYGVGCSSKSMYDPTASWGSFLVLLGFAAFHGHVGWNDFHRGDWTGLVWIAAWAGVLVIMVGWRLLARRTAGGNVLQCRFNSFGCVQCPLPQQITGLIDPNWLILAFWLASGGILFLNWIAHMTGRVPWVLLVLGVAGAVGLWWLGRFRSRQFQLRAPAAAKALMAAGAGFTPMAWASVRGVSIQPIKSRPGRYRLMFGKVIHAEVDCTGEQATALWTRVCAWRAAVGLPIEAQLLGGEKAKPAGGFPVLPPRPAAPAD
jgi:hypothetical protein